MSGVEIVGLIGGALSILKASKEIISAAVQARRDINQLPQNVRDLHTTLPLLETSLLVIRRQATDRRLSPELIKNLVPTVRVLRDLIQKLHDEFKSLRLDKNGGLKNFWTVIISRKKDKEILHQIGVILTYHQILRNAMPSELRPKVQGGGTVNNHTRASNGGMHGAMEYYGPTVIYSNCNFASDTNLAGIHSTPQGPLASARPGGRGPDPALALPVHNNGQPVQGSAHMDFQPTPAGHAADPDDSDASPLGTPGTPGTPGSLLGGGAPPCDETMTLVSRHSRYADNEQAIADANRCILAADGLLRDGRPAAAQAEYATARGLLDLFSTAEPALLVRKARGLTSACFGLTLTLPRAQRRGALAEAYGHNLAAHRAAARSPRAHDMARATLDKAHLKRRDGALRERAADAPAAAALRREAAALYLEVVAQLRDRCECIDDYDTQAQAHLGCGRSARDLGLVAMREDCAVYFNAGLECIGRAGRLGAADDDEGARERLVQTRTEICLCMSRCGAGIGG